MFMIVLSQIKILLFSVLNRFIYFLTPVFFLSSSTHMRYLWKSRKNAIFGKSLICASQSLCKRTLADFRRDWGNAQGRLQQR